MGRRRQAQEGAGGCRQAGPGDPGALHWEGAFAQSVCGRAGQEASQGASGQPRGFAMSRITPHLQEV